MPINLCSTYNKEHRLDELLYLSIMFNFIFQSLDSLSDVAVAQGHSNHQNDRLIGNIRKAFQPCPPICIPTINWSVLLEYRFDINVVYSLFFAISKCFFFILISILSISPFWCESRLNPKNEECQSSTCIAVLPMSHQF